MINTLNLSSELKILCGFSEVPNASQFPRLKINFSTDFIEFFNSIVKFIVKRLNPQLASILVADTTNREGYVKERNSKSFEVVECIMLMLIIIIG